MASETIDISEHQNGAKRRVVRHTFYGRDQKEAKHNERAHKRSDSFLKAALSGRRFKGIRLSVRKPKRSKRR